MHELKWVSDETVVVLVLVALCISVILAWMRFPKRGTLELTRWRRTASLLGLVGNTLSFGLLLGFLVLALLARYHNSNYFHLLWAFSFLFWIGFSLTTAVCGVFGRGIARLLVTANGIALASLWYMLGLANSP
jgi:hypothetical protein